MRKELIRHNLYKRIEENNGNVKTLQQKKNHQFYEEKSF